MTNRLGRIAPVTTDRSWNVLFPAAPVDVKVVPAGARPSRASSVSILNPSLSASSPDHTGWLRRSAITS
jgi:hypothetical protein